MKALLLVAATAALVLNALAQSQTITSAPSTRTASSSRAPVTTTVTVGLDHKYSPDTVSALPGDTVKFIFYPQNHSVAKAAYKHPCIPFEYVNTTGPTFFSGPKLSKEGDEQPIWLLKVNNTEPTFFYCAAPGSCVSAHMVGVINPTKDFSLDVQKAELQNTKFQVAPGDPMPAEESGSTTSGPGNNNGSGSGSPSGSGGTSLSGGAIAGIAIGGAAVLLFIVALIWFCGRKGGIEKGYRKSTVAAQQPSTPAMVEAHYPHDPKSPHPSYRDSPYSQHPDVFRAASPGQWSRTGSPHNSYMGHPSPEMQSPWQGMYPQHTGQSIYSDQGKPPAEAPVELPDTSNHPTNQPRHEIG